MFCFTVEPLTVVLHTSVFYFEFVVSYVLFCLGSPGGLGWGGNMRFRTGLNLIDLTAEVSRRLEHVKFPFLIMHDPGDSEFCFALF